MDCTPRRLGSSHMIEDLILGQDSEDITTQDSAQCSQALLTLTQQARRSLLIFSQQLDAKIYNSPEFYEAVLKLATSSRHADVRIIVRDIQPIIKQSSRLVQLSQRISSRMQIRTPPMEFLQRRDEFVIIDGRALLQRANAQRYQGEVDSNAPLRCRQLTQLFDDCWEKSSTPTDLKRLHI